MRREAQLRNSSKNLTEAILSGHDVAFTIACYIKTVLCLDKESVKPMADILGPILGGRMGEVGDVGAADLPNRGGVH